VVIFTPQRGNACERAYEGAAIALEVDRVTVGLELMSLAMMCSARIDTEEPTSLALQIGALLQRFRCPEHR
jgi:hypothetical protein